MTEAAGRRVRAGDGALRLAALILACAALAAACSGGDDGGSAAPTTPPEPTATSVAAAADTAPSNDFPTGPAVLVAADYQPPENRVDSTGAYFPVNGKPTFVFFDAIW